VGFTTSKLNHHQWDSRGKKREDVSVKKAPFKAHGGRKSSITIGRDLKKKHQGTMKNEGVSFGKKENEHKGKIGNRRTRRGGVVARKRDAKRNLLNPNRQETKVTRKTCQTRR